MKTEKRGNRVCFVKNPVPRAQGVKSQNKFILSFSGLTGQSRIGYGFPDQVVE